MAAQWTILRGAICLAIFAAAASGQPLSPSQAFVDITVIPMNNGPALLQHQNVVVRNGRIAAMGSVYEVPVTGVGTIIDGDGKFLIPGLTDMHIHLQDGVSPDANRAMLKLFVTCGVTTVRNMFGTADHLLLRKRIADGTILGPRVFTTGPVMDGNPPRLPRSRIVSTAEDAVAAVRIQKAMGFDVLKVSNNLAAESYLALVDAARKANLPVVGHVPLSVGLEAAIAAGQSGIEHLDGYIDTIEANDSPYRSRRDYQSRVRAFDYIDSAKLAKIVELTHHAGVTNCPTLVVSDKWVPWEERAALMKQPQVAYVPRFIVQRWESTLPFGSRAQTDYEAIRRAQEHRRGIVLALHRAGCSLITGTDTPSPYVIPGYSLIEEIQEFVKSGISPSEALRAATWEPALVLGRTDEFGTVQTGRSADLVMLEANPLDDIANLHRVAGVMLRGKWLPRQELDRLLSGL